jgi:predicted nuclease of predicted toxin-antitoxin system
MSSIPKGSKWSFPVDANLTTKLAKALDTAGYPAVTALDDPELAQKSDPVIFRHARAEQQIIITRDRDFLKVLEFPPPHAGIIRLRLPGKTGTAELIQAVLSALTELAGQDLSNKVYEVRPDGIHLV